MRQQLCAGALALALLGGVSIAAAQSGSGAGQSGSAAGQSGSAAQAKLELTPSQKQTLQQGLAKQAAQSAPSGFQAQIGGKVPASLKAQALPKDVAAQLP
jgi:hypothetical protein